MAIGAIDLSQVPAPDIIEQLDYEAILQAIQQDMISRGQAAGIDLADALSLETEPLNILAEACAYRELTLRNEFNSRAQACMLAYAVGPDLDNLGINLLVQRESGEQDPPYRARILEGQDGFSTAGPSQAYVFWAKSADPTVADVSVTSPAPAQVQVAILSTDPAGTPSETLIATVQTALSADTVRPLTDQVTVVPATIVNWSVVAVLDIGSGPDPTTVLAAAQAAVQAYGTAQRALGATIAVNAVIAALMQPGVQDLTLTSPAANIEGSPSQAPILGTITLTSAGAADD